MSGNASIHIYIGEPIKNRSERDCLISICEAARGLGGWSYIFANFHAENRQIDLAVFRDNTTLVVEAKGYFFPIKGQINGSWLQQGPYGERKIGNAYNQALHCKNALRDVIQKMAEVEGYPNALVANAPSIPVGSSITDGDFKVSIGGLDVIKKHLSKPSGMRLTEKQCKDLARHLCLEAISDERVVIDDEALEAESTYNTYVAAYKAFYKSQAEELVGDQYGMKGNEADLSEVHSAVNEDGSGIMIRGPSGCGKTLLSVSCSISCLNAGGIPIFVSAKNFEGDFKRLLDKEVSLLSSQSVVTLLRSAKTLGKRVTIFIDGYNECAEPFKLGLTRALRALSLRYDAVLVISTQCDLARPDLLSLSTVSVRPPSDELKYVLSGLTEGAGHREHVHSLLQVANSGLEAVLVRKIGNSMPPGASKFSLFMTYARTRLKANVVEGLKLLSTFANALVQRACFSLSVRELDRLCDSLNLTGEMQREVLMSGILQERSDRVSFIHELFFAAFSAEAVVRYANGDIVRIRDALASPRFSSSKTLILGAIEDDLLLNEILDECTDQDLIAAGARGECGSATLSILDGKLASMMDEMIGEAKEVRFIINDRVMYGIVIDELSLSFNLKNFSHYLLAIGDGLNAGKYHNSVMAACQNLDGAIEEFFKKSLPEAKAEKKQLRDAIFFGAYVLERQAAISVLINFISSGSLRLDRGGSSKFIAAIAEGWSSATTIGQFYFLLAITRFTECQRESASQVINLLREVTSYPYHFQLALIDFSGHLGCSDEQSRALIIDALEKSLDKLGIMMNSIIFEALRLLGALEDDEHEYATTVRQEIDEVLSTDNSGSDAAAWKLFSCQFDHPYEGAYWEEIQSLDDSRKKAFLTKACRGANVSFASFLGILIRQLSAFGDPSVAPAIIRLTSLPDRNSSFPQDTMEVYVAAHEALGHLGVPLPQFRGNPVTASDQALLACGELYYWSNRADVKCAEDSENTQTARATLLDHSTGSAASIIRDTASHLISGDGGRKYLVQQYPRMVLEICREAIKRKETQVSYFQHGFRNTSEEIVHFSITVVGGLGAEGDLIMLKRLCDDTQHGLSALKAIKEIETRLGFIRD